MKDDRAKISSKDKLKGYRKLRLLYKGNLILFNWYRNIIADQKKQRDLEWKSTGIRYL